MNSNISALPMLDKANAPVLSESVYILEICKKTGKCSHRTEYRCLFPELKCAVNGFHALVRTLTQTLPEEGVKLIPDYYREFVEVLSLYDSQANHEDYMVSDIVGVFETKKPIRYYEVAYDNDSIHMMSMDECAFMDMLRLGSMIDLFDRIPVSLKTIKIK